LKKSEESEDQIIAAERHAAGQVKTRSEHAVISLWRNSIGQDGADQYRKINVELTVIDGFEFHRKVVNIQKS